jgi:hypothetical protein
VLPCPPTSGVARILMRLSSSRSQPSGGRYLHTPTTLRRPQSLDACNPQTPAVFTRPQPSDTCHPHTLHVLEADDSPHRFLYSAWRYLLVVEEEKEKKSFMGCCPLEDPSRVCTPSCHCPSLAPYAAFFYSSCSGADGADLHETGHSCTFPHHWWWERVHVPITALSTSVPSSSYLSCGHLNVKLIRPCR